MTLLHGFREFFKLVELPSKEVGTARVPNLWGTQEYFLSEIEAGLEEGVHEFIAVKGRQQGITSVCDGLDLWWPQVYPGMTCMLVADTDDNRDFRRDVLRQMLESLPRTHRLPADLDNRGILRWRNGSRMLFDAAVQRSTQGKTRLGRSRGLNYLHADEVGVWTDTKAVSALQASLAERHPRRLYLWASTAQGFDLFRDMYVTAKRAAGSRAIFIGWWRHDLYTLDDQPELFKVYAGEDPDADERERIEAVARLYGHTITRGQLAWYRYQLVEKFRGNATLLMQEHPWVDTEAFQAFGDQFIPAHVVQRIRKDIEALPDPRGIRFDFPGKHMEAMQAVPADPLTAPLKIWEEPAPDGFYIVGGHPWGSSGPGAKRFVAQVWRAWPDKLRQVAEYQTDSMEMHQFAWVCMALGGIYRTWAPVDMVLEIGMSGMHVLAEVERISNFAYGVSPQAADHRERLTNAFGAIRHYLYQRPDSFRRTALKQMRATSEIRTRLFYGLRSELERDHVQPRSDRLIEQLSALRRGEGDDADSIGGGAGQDDSAAYTAALVTHMWLETTRNDLESVLAPSEIQPGQPQHVAEDLVKLFLESIRVGGG